MTERRSPVYRRPCPGIGGERGRGAGFVAAIRQIKLSGSRGFTNLTIPFRDLTPLRPADPRRAAGKEWLEARRRTERDPASNTGAGGSARGPEARARRCGQQLYSRTLRRVDPRGPRPRRRRGSALRPERRAARAHGRRRTAHDRRGQLHHPASPLERPRAGRCGCPVRHPPDPGRRTGRPQAG